uniref:Uncharacterized protein n=1 Tax=viral metagenome TaxID=1070528 RepID=A0A6C0LEK2_9ZZZZ
MASSSLLPSKYFDKLHVNRLKANEIKSDNISPESPSYLFSAVFNNALFERNQTGGTLTINKSDTEPIIQFSDRPFRQTSNIDFETFVSLYDTSGMNSFEEDPPNGVLTHSENQTTYIIRLSNINNEKTIATFNLELLPNETHNLSDVSGRMNLFVDNVTKAVVVQSPTKVVVVQVPTKAVVVQGLTRADFQADTPAQLDAAIQASVGYININPLNL